MPKKKQSVRACLRCGCTEDRACNGGCECVAGSDICSECLTPEEREVWIHLEFNATQARSFEQQMHRDRLSAEEAIELFGKMLDAAAVKGGVK